MSLIGQTAGETVSRMHATIGRGINLKVTPQQGHPQQITALTFCRSLASSGATPLPRENYCDPGRQPARQTVWQADSSFGLYLSRPVSTTQCFHSACIFFVWALFIAASLDHAVLPFGMHLEFNLSSRHVCFEPWPSKFSCISAMSPPSLSCKFAISNIGVPSPAVEAAPGNCTITSLEVEFRTTDAISNEAENSIVVT